MLTTQTSGEELINHIIYVSDLERHVKVSYLERIFRVKINKSTNMRTSMVMITATDGQS